MPVVQTHSLVFIDRQAPPMLDDLSLVPKRHRFTPTLKYDVLERET